MKLSNTWASLLRTVLRSGDFIHDETGDYLEISMMPVEITEMDRESPAIVKYISADNIDQMKLVFMGGALSKFGHDYWKQIEDSGQLGRAVERLRHKQSSRKAVIVLGSSNEVEWVPCINAIHLWVREGQLHLHYFSRGQDLWTKFVPDILALQGLQQLAIARMNSKIRCGRIAGCVSSAHLYVADVPNAQGFLKEIEHPGT